MPAAIPAEVREVAKSMFMMGLLPRLIAKELDLKPALVSKWAYRGNWTASRDGAKDKIISKGKASLALQAGRDLAAASANVRNSLAGTLEKQAAALAAQNPKHGDLANTRERQGAAAVAKTIAEAAEKVFQWGETSRPGLVLSVKLGADIVSKPTMASVIDLQPEPAIANPLQLQGEQLNVSNIVRKLPGPEPEPPTAVSPSPGQAPAASPEPAGGA